MNLKELEYIVKIADEHSLTRAAERLGITSSALNQQLLRLERELGLPLFFRARSGWQPTLAGEVYLDTAREMLQMKQIAYHRLQDIADPDRGSLSVGLDPERGGALLAAVGPAFRRESPQITLRIQEQSHHSPAEHKIQDHERQRCKFRQLYPGSKAQGQTCRFSCAQILRRVAGKAGAKRHEGVDGKGI